MAKKKKPNKKNEVQKVAGRPSKYKDEFAHMAYCMALAGMIDIEVAEVFEVDESTFTRWKQRYPALRLALQRGKAIANAQVAERLFERAMGYEHEDTQFFMYKGRVISKKYTKHYPPDVTAAIFFLKNRLPDVWRDVQRHTIGLTFPELMKRGLLKAKELNNEE